MEEKQEILIVAENSGFLPRAFAEQLTECGYQVALKLLNMQNLFDIGSAFEAVLLYMESEIQGYTQ